MRRTINEWLYDNQKFAPRLVGAWERAYSAKYAKKIKAEQEKVKEAKRNQIKQLKNLEIACKSINKQKKCYNMTYEEEQKD